MGLVRSLWKLVDNYLQPVINVDGIRFVNGNNIFEIRSSGEILGDLSVGGHLNLDYPYTLRWGGGTAYLSSQSGTDILAKASELKIYDGTNYAHIFADGRISSDSGEINLLNNLGLNNNILYGVGTPSSGSHVGNRDYNDARYLNVSGDTMQGDLLLNGNTIRNPADPTAGTHIGDRNYNDARYLQVSGAGQMSGDLNVGEYNIRYVNAITGSSNGAGNLEIYAANTHFFGHITMHGNIQMLSNDIIFDTTGGNIASAPTQKIGFWGVAPVAQPAAIADTSGASLAQIEAEINNLKQVLRDVGLLAT